MICVHNALFCSHTFEDRRVMYSCLRLSDVGSLLTTDGCFLVRLQPSKILSNLCRVILRYWGGGGAGDVWLFPSRKQQQMFERDCFRQIALIRPASHRFHPTPSASWVCQVAWKYPESLFTWNYPPSPHRRVTGHIDVRNCIRKASECIALHVNPLFG